jgi:uncharacterized protein YkwD
MLWRTWRRLGAIGLAVVVAALLAGSALAAPAKPSSQASSLSSLESGVLSDINAVRESHGLAPLRFSDALASAARLHSQEMAAAGFFSHNSGDGSAFWKRVQRFYSPSSHGYWSVGENLLWSSPDVDPAGALKMWMDSPVHRANLLTARWREVGISALHVSAAPGAFNGLDVTIVTADFGVRH